MRDNKKMYLSYDEDETICQIDIRSRKLIHRFVGCRSFFTITKDNQFLIGTGARGVLYKYSLQTKNLVDSQEVIDFCGWFLDSSNDSKLLFVTTAEKNLSIVHIDKFILIKTIENAMPNNIISMTFSKDNLHAFIINQNGYYRKFNIPNLEFTEESKKIGEDYSMFYLLVNNEKNYLLLESMSSKLYDFDSEEIIKGIPQKLPTTKEICYINDGTSIVVPHNKKDLKVLDLKTYEVTSWHQGVAEHEFFCSLVLL